jgi:hypothetical protein
MAAHEFIDTIGGDGVIEFVGVADGAEGGAFGIGGVVRFIEVAVEYFLGAGV